MPPLPLSKRLELLFNSAAALLRENIEAVFILFTLGAISVILHFLEQKISFLTFFFIPVLLVAYFMNARSAMMGALLAVCGIAYLVQQTPQSFYGDINQVSLYLHVILWGTFLVLTGWLVGRMIEQLRERFRRAEASLDEVEELKERLAATNRKLEDQNEHLELSKSQLESLLFSTMDPVVARLIIDRKLENESRELSLLSADLVNFAGVAKDVTPNALIEELNRVYTAMEPVLTRFRGHLDRYLGDGLLAEFGAPFPARHHQLLAVLAGMKMQQRMGYKQFPWKLRVGIASGESLVGFIGSQHRRNYTAVGETVQTSQRLMALCPPGGVLVDERIASFVRRWFHLRLVRGGLKDDEAKNLEARLDLLVETIYNAPSADLCMEAANLCSELGDMSQAVRFHKMALELDPSRKKPVEQAVAAAMLTGDDRAYVTIKGRRRRIAAHEVVGLKDPLEDGGRLPPKVVELARKVAASVEIPKDWVLSIEALEGAIGHCAVTAALGAALADALGLEEEQVHDAYRAGFLHDIGKKNVPEHLLAQEGRMEALDRPEIELIKSHVAEAVNVMRDLDIPSTPELRKAIEQHHERYDGSGYPAGLRGQSIGLLARIIQIADTYELLTSWRPRQDAVSPRAALAEILDQISEGKLDPKIGKIFVEMMKRL